MKSYIILFFSIFTLWACQHEVIPSLEKRGITDYGDSIELVVPIACIDPSLSSLKALTPTEEIAITDLRILVFEDQGSQETFAYQGKTTVIDQGNSFKLRLKKSVGQVRLVCLANLGNDTKNIVDAFVVGVEKRSALATVAQSIAEIYSTRIPMWGESNLVVLNENLDLLGLGTGRGGSIEVYRSMSRINIRNLLPRSTFDLTKVYFYNGRTAMAIVPSSIGTLTVAGSVRSTPLLYTLTASDLTSQTLLNTIYVAETSVADKTALVLAGKYNSFATETFYKVMIQKEGIALDLQRNNSYEISITHVAGEGYATATEAYNSAIDPIWIRTDVQPWTSLPIDGLDELQPYPSIVTSADVLYFSATGGSQNIIVLSQTDFSIDHSIDAVNISPLSGVGGVETTIQVTADPNTGNFKKGSFTLTAGSLSKDISIEQLGVVIQSKQQ